MNPITPGGIDCCGAPVLEKSPFAYDTSKGETWSLLTCQSCRGLWCRAVDSAGVEWYTRLLGQMQPTPLLKLGPAADLVALRSRQRSLRVCGGTATWIEPDVMKYPLVEPSPPTPSPRSPP